MNAYCTPLRGALSFLQGGFPAKEANVFSARYRWSMWKKTGLRALVALVAVTIAAPAARSAGAKHWLQTYADANGGCDWYSRKFEAECLIIGRTYDGLNYKFFGRPLAEWTADDFATASRMYQNCQAPSQN